jgi:uncharacterized protein with PIN domain
MPLTCWKNEGVRFLVDENLPAELADLLRSSGHDVLYVSRSGLRTAADNHLNDIAISEERVIVTSDLDFPLQGQASPLGLVILRLPRGFDRGQIVELMARFQNTPEFTGVIGRITVVRPNRIRTRRIEDA